MVSASQQVQWQPLGSGGVSSGSENSKTTWNSFQQQDELWIAPLQPSKEEQAKNQVSYSWKMSLDSNEYQNLLFKHKLSEFSLGGVSKSYFILSLT